MMQRLIAVLLMLSSAPVFAQRGPCGGFFSSAFVPQPDYSGDVVVLHPAVDVHVPGGSFGGGGGGGIGNINDGFVFLVVVVVAAAALPLVLYGVDEEAGLDVRRCWESPFQYFQTYGGAMGTTAGTLGYVGLRGGAAMGFLGFDVAAETAPFAYHDLMAAVTLRAPPRQHVELGLSVGYRQVADLAYGQQYLEVALPHRYLPFRGNAWSPGVGLEVRPAVMFSPRQAIDARLDLAVTFPLGPHAQLSAGGRFYSLAMQVHAAAQVGFQFGL